MLYSTQVRQVHATARLRATTLVRARIVVQAGPQHKESSPTDLPASLERRTLLLGTTVLTACSCGCATANEFTSRKLSWRDQFFAFSMAEGMEAVESRLASTKSLLFAQLLSSPTVQQVLEVGVGAGPNFHFYAEHQHQHQQPLQVVGLDPNEAMFSYSWRTARRVGLCNNLSLVVGSAEVMPFEDNSFDAAVFTLVLCSIPDVGRALAEVRRVVRPGGKVLLVEHVIAPEPGLLRLAQTALDPLQQLVAGGCHLTRDTKGAVAAAGFSGLEGLQHLTVKGLGILSPFVAGIVHV